MLTSPPAFSVLGLPIHLLNNYCDWLITCLRHNRGVHVVTLNAEMAMLAEHEPRVAQIIRQADLIIPDGAGVVIYLKLRGKQQRRCPGIELAESLLNQLGTLENSPSVAFYGGKPGVTDAAAAYWRHKNPELTIIESHGYLSASEEAHWKQTLQTKQPKVILVGLGVPRQEFWIVENRFICPEAIWIGVGGSFDIWSGIKNRAPRWLRENHLEWLYRLYQEPWRWRRMLVLPQFFWRALLSR